MKASIITKTRTYNYGATLQAYALQEYVKSMGHDCSIIDHINPGDKHKKLSLFDWSLENVLMIPYKRRLERGYANFEEFYRKHMNMTVPYQNEAELNANPPDADVFISGSDQVWNPREAKMDKFFLTFAPKGKKRISYAASLGVSEIPDEKRALMCDYIRGIDGISLRENRGRELVEKLTDKPITVNCDPVFLLGREYWRSIETPVKGLIPGEYILCYMIYRPQWFSQWVKTMKKKTGKKIVVVGLQGYRRIYCDRYIRDAGPKEFLWLIDNAAAVATTSFHGSAFSILFGKPFAAIPDPPRPVRIRNLLQLFQLEHNELNGPNNDFEFSSYEYDMILSVLDSEIQKSRAYLASFLGE